MADIIIEVIFIHLNLEASFKNGEINNIYANPENADKLLMCSKKVLFVPYPNTGNNLSGTNNLNKNTNKINIKIKIVIVRI